MITARIDINGQPIDELRCVRVGNGPDDGWNDYVCTCGEHTFRVRHNRPDGYWALIATAASMLAEAGVGVRMETMSEEG